MSEKRPTLWWNSEPEAQPFITTEQWDEADTRLAANPGKAEGEEKA